MTSSSETKKKYGDKTSYDMLDIIVILVENWLFLFIVPIIIATIFYFGYGSLERPWVASMNVPAAPAALDDPIVMAFVAKNSHGSGKFLVERSIERSGAYFRLHASSASRDDASITVEKAAATLMELQAAAINAEVESIDKRLENLKAIESSSPDGSSSTDIASVYALAFAVVGAKVQVDKLTVQRTSKQREHLLLADTGNVILDQQGRSPAFVAVAVAILSSISIALLLLARLMWNAVAGNPENAIRIERIKRAFKLRRGA